MYVCAYVYICIHKMPTNKYIYTYIYIYVFIDNIHMYSVFLLILVYLIYMSPIVEVYDTTAIFRRWGHDVGSYCLPYSRPSALVLKGHWDRVAEASREHSMAPPPGSDSR